MTQLSESPQTPHIILQPGWHNSGPHHWQTLWEEELGVAASRVQQQEWAVPEESAWTAALIEAIREAPRPSVVLAHSAGCLATVFALSAVSPAAVVLVAPTDAERAGAPVALQSFTPIPLKPLKVPALLIASDNDPYCSLERARAFAAAWKADLEIVRDGGHLNADAGFGPWPDGRLTVSQWLKRHGLQWPGPGGGGA